MNRTLSEKKVLRKLGISDFRHMTKDKVVSFATMLPRMDPAVAKAAIEQFPNCRDLSLELVNQYKGILDVALHENRASNESFCEACNTILDSLRRELEQEGITSEDRERIETRMIDVVQMLKDNVAENRDFLKYIVQKATIGVMLIIAFGGALLGVKAVANGNNDSDENYDDEAD